MTSVALADTRRAATSPAFSLRLAVWLRRTSLDWALADGAFDSPQLRLRAQQIVRPGECSRIADRLELAVEDAADQARFSATAPLNRVAIALAHAELGWLIAALRTAPDPSPKGVAMAARLLSDGASPLYAPHTATALRNAACRIGAELG